MGDGNYETIFIPIKSEIKQIARLIKIFATAFHKSPVIIIWNVSLVKVEKVLNPPQKPVIMRKTIAPPSLFFRFRPTRMPNIKQANTLAKIVAQGN